MDKHEFLTQLKKELMSLPEEEQQRAISYYEEYLEEAKEEEIKELETPQKIAQSLIDEYGNKDIKNNKKNDMLPLFIILGIFASPFLIAIGCCIFAVLISIWAFVLCFGITGFAFGIVGIALMVLSCIALFTSFSTFLFLLGTSLLCIALSLLLFKFTWFISIKIAEGIKYLLQKITKKGVKHENI